MTTSTKIKKRDFAVVDQAIILLFAVALFVFASSDNGMIWDLCSMLMVGYSALTVFVRQRIPKRPYIVWFAIISLLFTISIVYSKNQDEALMSLIVEYRIVIYSVMFMLLQRRKGNLKWTALSFYIASIVLSIYMINSADWSNIVNTSTRYANTIRVTLNANQHVNLTSYNLVIGFMLGIFFMRISIFEWSFIKKVLFIIGEVLIVFAIFLSGSRKVLIPIAIMIIAQFWDKKRAGGIIIGTAVVVMSAYLIMKVPVLYQILGSRLEGIFSGVADASSQERVLLIKDSFRVYLNNPVLGVGINQYLHYSIAGLYAHNNYLEILANFGTIGFFVYYSIIIYSISRLCKLKSVESKFKTTMWAVISSFMIMDFFQVSYNINVCLIFIALVSEYVSSGFLYENQLDKHGISK